MVAFTAVVSAVSYPLAEMEIKFTGTELDEAQFVCAQSFALDAAVTINADATAQFIGYIKEKEEIEQGALYRYTAYEKAVELKTMPYLSSSSDVFSKTLTVNNLASDILTSTPASGWTLSGGYSDSTSVTLNFYMVNRLQAFNKVLREMKGYYVIFNSSASTAKYLCATDANTDRTGSGNISYVTKTLKSSSMLRGISQIVVIGQDSSIRGEYGSSTSSRAYYQVDDITTDAEALAIATAIYNDIGVSYEVYEVEVDPTQIQYDVRDKIAVDSVNYYISQVIQGMDAITLTIDTGKTSVIDSLGSRIHKIEGNFPSGTDAQWSGGNTNVAANAAAYTEYTFEVKDVNIISNAKLDARIGSFIKSANVATETEYLSDVDTVTSETTTSDSATFVSAFYVPDSSGESMTEMSAGWQHAYFTLSGLLQSDGSPYWLRARVQVSPDGSSWTSIGSGYIETDTSIRSWVISGLLSGTTVANYDRFRIYVTAESQIKAWNLLGEFYRLPRHKHSVTTTYDKTTTGTPPTTLTVKVNSGSDTTLTPGTPLDIQSLLITGKNVIYVKTPASAGNQCSVNPTITYQTLGKS